jgi:AcrR family transcriptional regulator
VPIRQTCRLGTYRPTVLGVPVGLRERKKQQTRRALRDAALHLAVTRGLDHVRTEDIAEAAGVAPRTFRNYFANKYDAIVDRHVDRSGRTAAELRARPLDEPLWEALEHAVLAPFLADGRVDRAPDPERMAALRLVLAEPALQAEIVKVRLDADRELARAIADRTGTDPAIDLYPLLVAAAVAAAGAAATQRWLHADPPVPLASVVAEAIRALAAGLPDPSAGGRR